MSVQSNEWVIAVRMQLSRALKILDLQKEPLVAAHVATAIDCLDRRNINTGAGLCASPEASKQPRGGSGDRQSPL